MKKILLLTYILLASVALYASIDINTVAEAPSPEGFIFGIPVTYLNYALEAILFLIMGYFKKRRDLKKLGL